MLMLSSLEAGKVSPLIEKVSDHKDFKKLLRTRTNVLVLYTKTGWKQQPSALNQGNFFLFQPTGFLSLSRTVAGLINADFFLIGRIKT